MFDGLKAALKRWADKDPELEDVRDLHVKFGILNFETPGHLTKRKLRERVEAMREELEEFAEAADDEDMDGMVDALIDLVYFAKGTAVMLGLRYVWNRSWREVQRANMTKVRGVTHRGHAVDLVKPPGWRPPNHGPALHEAGYRAMSVFNPRDDEGAPVVPDALVREAL